MERLIMKSSKYKRINFEDRCTIGTLLNEGKSVTYIARQIDKSLSSVTREIMRHRSYIASKGNICTNRFNCKKKFVCSSKCYKSCRQCTRCKDFCLDYQEEICPRIEKTPYVCNGCTKKICHLKRYRYNPQKAQEDYVTMLCEKRSGFDLTEEEIQVIDELVSPLIKKGIAPYQIKAKLGDKIPVSEATLRRMIGDCVLDARNIDLRHTVKRKVRRKRSNFIENFSPKKDGRTYKDYLKYISTHDVKTVEMDCVEGKKSDNAVLLTLHFAALHFQLAFIMPMQTCRDVVGTLDKIESAIGTDMFKEVFPLILTDNGHEFFDIKGMERSIDGVSQRTHIFFCEPLHAEQKGHCESNHRIIRYIIPKGKSLEPYEQMDITLMTNHVNSYPRPALNGKSPFELAQKELPGDFFTLLGLEFIPFDELIVNPSLLASVKVNASEDTNNLQ